MAIIGIVAADRNGAIGKAGGLPWHYSSDMRFFKSRTTGHACLMGYKTWLTLKRPLPNRLNIVLSRRSEIEPQESVVVLRERQSALSLAKYLAGDLYVIGGAEIFRAFLGDIQRWLVTEIPLAVEGADTFMPASYLEGFATSESIELEEALKVRVYDRVPGN
ncbi:MAG TPA: dihydrofolate reductase [Pyrinomonadaceae bacterium]